MPTVPPPTAARARESAIAAEGRVEELLDFSLRQLHYVNTRMTELQAELKAAQPKASGSVCLELYTCGPGCSGCPHPRWMKYTWTKETQSKPARLIARDLSAKKQDPVTVLPRATEHYQKTAELIREAKAILKARANLLSCLKSLRIAARLPGLKDSEA